MNKNFVIIGVLIIVGLTFLYPKYQQKQYENEVRERFKNLKMDEGLQKAVKGMPIEVSMLNQYPNFIVYMMMTQFEGQDIPEYIKDTIKSIPCENLKMYRSESEMVIEANSNIFEKDNIAWTYIVKNKYGKELFNYKKVVNSCTNFSEFKNYAQKPVIANASDSMPVSQKAVKENARFENGQ